MTTHSVHTLSKYFLSHQDATRATDGSFWATLWSHSHEARLWGFSCVSFRRKTTRKDNEAKIHKTYCLVSSASSLSYTTTSRENMARRREGWWRR